MKSNGYIKYLKRIKRNNILIITTQVLIVLMFIILWQVLSDKKIIDTFLLSSPKKVLNTIITLTKEHSIFNHIFTTIYEIIISFILGNLIGLLISSIFWFNKFISKVFDPFLTILNSLVVNVPVLSVNI